MPFVGAGRMAAVGRSPLFSIGVTVCTPAVPFFPCVVSRTVTPDLCVSGVGTDLTSQSTSSLLCWPSACFATLLVSVTPASSFLSPF